MKRSDADHPQWTQIPLRTGDGDPLPVTAAFLHASDRQEALRELAFLAAQRQNLDDSIASRTADSGTTAAATADIAEKILELAAAREVIAPSVVDEEIAFPHAVFSGFGSTVAVVGVAPAGIAWGPTYNSVSFLALFAGNEEQHLPAMATVAAILRDSETRRRLAVASSDNDLVRILSEAAGGVRIPEESAGPGEGVERFSEVTRAFLDGAGKLASGIADTVVAIVSDTFPDGRLPEGLLDGFEGFLLGPPQGDVPERARVIEDFPFGSSEDRNLERDVIRAAVHGSFGSVSSLLVASGETGSGILNSLQLVFLRQAGAREVVPGLNDLVTRRVERLARQIAHEGREGKRVGCFFVIADPVEISRMTHQLLVNPFLGYPREERNVLDPSLEETLKEFSKIDGAFVIDRDGTVESAGTYIAVNPENLEHRSGEGTRHASARAVTAVADAIAIVVSESTGRVSIYAAGKLVG